ncbi:MAG TPA: hypothetical protein VH113_09565 [Gemmatimonadales bacterium]|jgi:hypothetical protein|nr:hypothetical protein [Gemmatimonadales bacterium]
MARTSKASPTKGEFGLRQIAEIVHDVDLKDEKFERPEDLLRQFGRSGS